MTDYPTVTPFAAPVPPENLPNRNQPELPPAEVRWGVLDLVLCLLAYVVIEGLSFVLVFFGGIDVDHDAAVGLFTFVLGLVLYGAFLGILAYASKRKGYGSFSADFGLRFTPRDIPIAIGAVVAAKIAAILFGVLAVLVTGGLPETGNFELSGETVWIVLNGIVIASIIGPIVEELVFRGLGLRAIRNYVLRRAERRGTLSAATPRRAVVWGVLLSSLAFASLHFLQATSAASFIVIAGSTFAVGVINAVIAHRTGRLGAPIIMHVLYNGSAIVLALSVTS